MTMVVGSLECFVLRALFTIRRSTVDTVLAVLSRVAYVKGDEEYERTIEEMVAHVCRPFGGGVFRSEDVALLPLFFIDIVLGIVSLMLVGFGCFLVVVSILLMALPLVLAIVSLVLTAKTAFSRAYRAPPPPPPPPSSSSTVSRR